MLAVQCAVWLQLILYISLLTPLPTPPTVAATLEFHSHLCLIPKGEGALEAGGPAILC